MNGNLTRLVGELYRVVDPVSNVESIGKVAHLLNVRGVEALPVVAGGTIVGMATQSGLAQALRAGLESDAPVGAVLSAAPPSVGAHESAATALRMLADGPWSMLLVVDAQERLVGVIRPSDLVQPPFRAPRPKMVGGMATPFGVYLTNGTLRAGAKGLPLVLTGAALVLLHSISVLTVYTIFDRPWFTGSGLSGSSQLSLVGFLITAMFLGLLRASPLAGIHAAEHMTVHAIEQGEPLTPAVVGRMPRLHPRCGTNFVTGMLIFLTVVSGNWTPDQELKALVAALSALLLWRPVGMWLQRHVTTKPPSARQIQLGIDAGEDLLRQYASRPGVDPSFWTRLAATGLPFILLGSTTTMTLIVTIAHWVPWMAPLRVSL